MFKKILVFTIAFLIISIMVSPSLLMASKEVKMSGLVPVCNTEIGVDGTFVDACGFDYFMTMLNYIIDWSLKYLATPIFAILFMYAGFLYISEASNPGNKAKAKKMMKNALIGYLLILSAWLIVDTIFKGLGFTGGTFLADY